MILEVIVHVLSKESKYFYLTAVKRTLPRHLLNLQPLLAAFSLVSFLLSLIVFFTCVLSVSILVLICTKLENICYHFLVHFCFWEHSKRLICIWALKIIWKFEDFKHLKKQQHCDMFAGIGQYFLDLFFFCWSLQSVDAQLDWIYSSEACSSRSSCSCCSAPINMAVNCVAR